MALSLLNSLSHNFQVSLFCVSPSRVRTDLKQDLLIQLLSAFFRQMSGSSRSEDSYTGSSYTGSSYTGSRTDSLYSDSLCTEDEAEEIKVISENYRMRQKCDRKSPTKKIWRQNLSRQFSIPKAFFWYVKNCRKRVCRTFCRNLSLLDESGNFMWEFLSLPVAFGKRLSPNFFGSLTFSLVGENRRRKTNRNENPKRRIPQKRKIWEERRVKA